MSTHLPTYHLKHYLPYFILMTILGLGVLAATFLSLNNQEIRNKASEGSSEVTLSTSSPSGNTHIPSLVATTIDISANFASDRTIDGIQVILDVDGNFNAFSIEPTSIPGLNLVVNTVNSIPGKRKVALLFVTSDPATPLIVPAGNLSIATIHLTPTSPGSSISVTFDHSLTKIIESATHTNLASLFADSIYTTSTDPTPVPVCGNNVCEQNEETSCVADCQLSTAPVCAQTTIAPNPSSGPAPLSTTLQGSGSAGNGSSITGYQWDFDGDGTWDSDISLIPANHTYTVPGTYQPVYRVQNQDNLWSSTCTYPYTITVTSSNTSVNSATLQVKFRGVKKDVGPVVAKVSWSNTNDESGAPNNVTFTHTSGGVYQATVNLGTTSGPYSIAIKGEKHLQHVFRNVTIATDHTINLTNYSLEPGDLPIAGAQDGYANTTDINAILAAMAKADPTSADLAVADLNYDGVINAGDMAQILVTLSTKPDEELN